MTSQLWRLALAAFALLLNGCPTAPGDAPPPPRKPEIPSAPPHALGALAAGTDAAPRPELSPVGEEPDVAPSEPTPGAPEDAPAPSEAPEAPAPAPTAPGMAL